MERSHADKGQHSLYVGYPGWPATHLSVTNRRSTTIAICAVRADLVTRGIFFPAARSRHILPFRLGHAARGKYILDHRRISSKDHTICEAQRGDGAEAVLRYLARYVFRVAITESRIVGLDDTGVTIRHKHRASGRWRKTCLHGHEFMRRFLQHVLPKGFHKVRYSGLWHPSRRDAAA